MNKQQNKQAHGWLDKVSAAESKEQGEGRFWSRLALNKWSLTFALILVMLSAYLGLEEVSKNSRADEVLYVMDTLPYDVQKVNGENKSGGSIEVLGENRQQSPQQNESENKTDNNQKNESANSTENNQEKNSANAADTDADTDNTAQTAADGSGKDLDKYSINSDSDFFINYRLEREKARARQLELLQELIDDENTGAEIRKEAQAKVIAQAEAIEGELMLESILVAKYGGEAAVFIQPEKVNVVLDLDKDKMADNEADKIARIVDNYTGIGYENIIIVLKD